MNKRCLWLANGCLEHYRPIIINSCPPKRSQKSLIWRTIPAKIHGLNFRLLISIFKFITWILQLNSKIYTLPLEFTSLENVNFQLDEHIFIQYHCYFLLDLMTETLLYIWLIYEALFTLQWSLVETKETFVGVGDGDRSTSSPGSFVHHALWKEGVGRQHTTSTSSQNLLNCSF